MDQKQVSRILGDELKLVDKESAAYQDLTRRAKAATELKGQGVRYPLRRGAAAAPQGQSAVRPAVEVVGE